MAISYVSEAIKGSEYIEPYDTDVVHKALMYQQQQYDTNVQKTQQGIDELSGMDVISPEDKQYRDALINGFTAQVNSMAGMDFSKMSTMNMVNQAKRVITSDERLLGAVQDTAQMRSKQKHQADLIKKGQYSDANMWEDAQADLAYLQAKKTDPNARYHGSSYATPYKDVSKVLQKTALEVAKLKASGEKQIPMARQVVNEDGTITTTHDMVSVKGISDQELQAYVMQTLPAAEQRQLSIDARYRFKDATPESLITASVSSMTNKYMSMKNRLNELDKALKQTVKGSPEEKQYLDEQQSLSKVYNEQIKNRTAQITELAKSNPDALKLDLHRDELATTYGALYSNQSTKITEDRPYYTEKKQQLDRMKFQHDIQVDAIKLQQNQEALQLKRDKLAADIADDQADNARADLKAGDNTGRTGTGGTGTGVGTGSATGTTAPAAASGVTGAVEKTPVKTTYADFKQQGIDLQQQEMDAVMTTLVDIAHQQDSSIFQNPELRQYLGAGQGAKLNIVGPDGKVNPTVADKLGKYFDKIGLTGIMPKMQGYYEAIARGGHPDTYATFKDYLPLANALAGIKEKQKQHALQSQAIDNGAIDVLHKEVGSRLTRDQFARNVRLIERVQNKIGAYKPTTADNAKWAAASKSTTRLEVGQHSGMGFASAMNQGAGRSVADLVLNDSKGLLTAEGAAKLGISEKERVEYNKQRDFYGGDLMVKYAKAKDTYSTTTGTAFVESKTFNVPEAESKKDTATSSLLTTTITTNPVQANIRVTGTDKPLDATDPRIANIKSVRVLDHTVSRANNASTARVEITYGGGNDEKAKDQKYVATMNLSNATLDNAQFRGGAARRNPYQEVLDTIDDLGGRSETRYINYQSPNVKSPDPIGFVFERSPLDPKDNRVYMKIVVKDAKGNDMGFQYGGRSTPDELVKNFSAQLNMMMEKGLSKQAALEALRRTAI